MFNLSPTSRFAVPIKIMERHEQTAVADPGGAGGGGGLGSLNPPLQRFFFFLLVSI